jgi:hypothetical protein
MVEKEEQPWCLKRRAIWIKEGENNTLFVDIMVAAGGIYLHV